MENYRWCQTAADPCPVGYHVTTSAEWTGVNTNNTVSRTGTWTLGITEYGTSLHYGPDASTSFSSLPAAGGRISSDGLLFNRGAVAGYWGGNHIGLDGRLFSGISIGVTPASNFNRGAAYPIRCIAD